MSLMQRLQKRLATPKRDGTPDLRAAVDAYNRDHGRDWGPPGRGTCPVCGHHDCFGNAGGSLRNSGRWACFSANHGNVGVTGQTGAHHHGDALDVDADAAGRTRIEHLRQTGYLKDPAKTPETPPDRKLTPAPTTGHPRRKAGAFYGAAAVGIRTGMGRRNGGQVAV